MDLISRKRCGEGIPHECIASGLLRWAFQLQQPVAAREEDSIWGYSSLGILYMRMFASVHCGPGTFVPLLLFSEYLVVVARELPHVGC
jgi:hypothetical protein